mgnify:CR=1 FL=1
MPEQLVELYKRRIDRRIDPVATVSELSDDYVKKEIEEYFFTDTLFKHLHTFLDKLTAGTEGRTGVWINGYYGSGKSHFLKYIYYCLSDHVREKALDHFKNSLSDYEGDPLDQPVSDRDVSAVRKRLQGLEVDPVMFNIKNVSDDDRGQRSVTKTFYRRLNAHRGYNKSDLQVARFEKVLDEQGALQAFKTAFAERTGDDWDAKANDAVEFMLDEVIATADSVANIDVEATRATLLREASVTTEEFVDELEHYLAEKPDNYRLVYLVDEVSQYMQGEPNLLVDLQTIIEEIGDRIGDKMWVVCTAQQELKDLVETAKEKQQADYSYGKIISRFETYLPLESQQADLITKKRVLSKNPEGADTLRTFFTDHETAVRNQFQSSGSAQYRGYTDREEFVAAYPFVPYQFKLIVEVIDAFAKADFLVPGTAGTERSLIGLAHEVAIKSKSEAVGYFVPFDEFYNARLADKLTHHARSIIANAMRLQSVSEDAFAQRVVKALFLLSNIARDQSIDFPATVENMAFILINTIDPNWSELKRKTQEVLDELVDENVVSESEGTYRFLQEEEIRVKREIDNQSITLHDRLRAFAERVVQEEVRWSSRVKLEGTPVQLHLKVDDYEESSTGTATVEVLLYNTEDPSELSFKHESRDLLLCLHEQFEDEQKALLDKAVRIGAYLQEFQDSATGERQNAMNTFKDQGDRAIRDLRAWFRKTLASTTYVSDGQQLDASDKSSGSAQTLYQTLVEEHLYRVYSKRTLATGYASDRGTMHQKAARKQAETDDTLTQAETEVNNFLSLHGHPTLADVMRKYDKPPFGWQDTEVMHILLNLEAKNKWAFKWNSEEVGRETFAEKGIRSGEQASITIHKQEDVDPAVMDQATRAINHTIFNESLVEASSDPRRLRDKIEQVLSKKGDNARSQANQHRGRPFAHHFEELAEALKEVRQAPDAKQLFKQVIDQASELQKQVERVHELVNFWERNGDTYNAIQQFVNKHEANEELLDPTTKSRLHKLATYVRNEALPHERFRSMLDYYEAAQDVVQEKVETLREQAVNQYEGVFDDLEARQQELEVDNVLPSRSDRMNMLRRTENLASLQQKISTVSDFRAKYLRSLNDAAASNDEDAPKKHSQIVNVRDEISHYELDTESDVDELVDDLRRKLLQHINDGKRVILK